MQNTKRLFIALGLCVLAGGSWAAAKSAQDIIKEAGVQGGLVVHLGAADGKKTAELSANGRFVVHGLYRRRQQADEARKYIKQLKPHSRYGAVSVQHWDKDKKHLPYADNLVNFVVAEDLSNVPMTEVARVLAPLGSALVKSGETWKKISKPWPGQIDEWTHYLHGPDNNAVAQDTRVGPPTRVQWIGFPKFARSHEQLASLSAMVSSRGRVFYLIDEGLRSDIRMPPRWKLVARDAFNGVVLWKRNIDKWSDHMHGFRSGPPDLPFRLVADGDRVYVTLGLDQPVTALDAGTGKTLLTYKGSAPARQIIHTGETLVMLLGDSQVAIHMKRRGDKESARRVIMAANRKTGDTLWRKEVSVETLLPLVVSGDSLLYQTDANLVCLKLKSGDKKWSIPHPCRLAGPRSGAWSWASPTLVAHNGIVYVADFRKLSAFSIDGGKALWDCSSAPGFCSPPDIFIINDLVWRGYTLSRGSADFAEGLDARTGKLKKTIDTKKAWDYATLAHHRCYRPKATSRFIMSSRSGVEFIDVKSGKINPNHWVRGTCQYGIMPANGLLYAPPHSCACNIKTMLKGMYALTASRREPAIARAADLRFETGVAFGKVPRKPPAGGLSDDWPTFRHDNQRSGRTATPLAHSRECSGARGSDRRCGRALVVSGRRHLRIPARSGNREGAAFMGRQGAVIRLVSAADGKKLAEYKLESTPVFDGMIAARSRLFISLEDGSLVCFGQ